MARDFAKRFYNSKEWRKCRESYIDERKAIDGGMCETCRTEPGRIVHHTIWLTPENITNPEITLNHELLKYDCITCHNKEEEQGEELRYRFGADGQILPPP